MAGQGFGLPAPLPVLSERRKQDLPSSRQILSIHALLPSDPGGTGAPGHSALAMLPSTSDTVSAPTTSKFRGSITRPASSLSTASQLRLPERHARLTSGWWPPLPGRASTRRICSESFRVTHLTSSLPLSPSFARRTPPFAIITILFKGFAPSPALRASFRIPVRSPEVVLSCVRLSRLEKPIDPNRGETP